MRKSVLLFFVIALFAVSCGKTNPIPTSDLSSTQSSAFPTLALPTFTPQPTGVRQSSSSSLPPAECIWEAGIQSWIDSNANGAWDTDEQPLRDVVVIASRGTESLLEDRQYSISDESGKGKISVMLWGCPSVVIQVNADAPANYVPTTPNQITSSKSGSLKFGFQYTGTGTPTPFLSSSLICKLYQLPSPYSFASPKINDIAVTLTGVAWAARSTGDVARIDPNESTPTTFYTKEGLFTTFARVITVAPDGTIWLGTDKGVARFAGSSWTQENVISKNRYTLENAYDMVIDNTGALWVAHAGIASRFDPKANSWEMEIIPKNWLTSNESITAIKNSSRGYLWVFSTKSIYRLPLPTTPNATPTWTIHKEGRIANLMYMNYKETVVMPNETMWFVGTNDAGPSVVHYDPIKQDWTTFNHRTTNGDMPGGIVTSIATAKDNSLWIGTSQNGAIHFIPNSANGKSGTWLHYTSQNGLVNSKITKVAVAPDGFIWFGTSDGQIMRCKENLP